jgi:capsular exopolysaccharide synthesis family protein
MEPLIPENKQPQQYLQSDNLASLKDIIRKYVFHWKWFALSVMCLLAFAFIHNRYSVFIYRTSARVYIVEDENSNSKANIFSDLGVIPTVSNVDNEIELMKSRKLIAKVVDSLQLRYLYVDKNSVTGLKAEEIYNNTPFRLISKKLDSLQGAYVFHVDITSAEEVKLSYELKPQSGALKSYSIKFGDSIVLPEIGVIKVIKTEHFNSGHISKDFDVTLLDKATIVNSILATLEIATVKEETSVLSIALVGPTPAKNEAIINELIRQNILDKLTDQKEVAFKTSEFIKERVSVISKELSDVDIEDLNFKKQNNIIDVQTNATSSLTKESDIENRLIQVNIQHELASYVNDYLQQHKNPYDVLPSNLGFEDNSVSGLIATYNELVLGRAKLLMNSTEQNPVIIRIDNQIQQIKNSLKSSLSNMLHNYTVEMKALKAKQALYSSELAKVPDQEKGFRDIQRQQQIKETLYLYLLQKREENEISSAASISNLKVIDDAFTAGAPIAPNKLSFYIMALALGLIIPAAVIYLIDLLDTKIHSSKDIEKFGIPFLGAIPKDVRKNKITGDYDPHSSLAEAFRILRTNLSFMSSKEAVGKVILVTSTVPGEGKTYVTSNLAYSFAQTGKKVVVVGLDLRLPKIPEAFNIMKGKGVSDFLAGEIESVETCINKNVTIKGLDVLQSGSIPPNPSELLMRKEMAQLIEELKNKYDFVFIDTPPVSVVADTIIINHLSDVTLYVTRVKKTEMQSLHLLRTLIADKKLSNVGTVINDVDFGASYHGYNYGYKYGYGYGGKRKKSWKDRLLNKSYSHK